MESTITGLGLAVFGVLAVFYLTTDLTALLAGRDVLPQWLRPIASAQRGPSMASAIGSRLTILVLGQAVVVGVLISGIASRDAVAQLALVAELILSTLWVAWLAFLSRTRRRAS